MGIAYTVATKIVGEDLASEAFRKVSGAANAAFKPIDEFKSALDKPGTTALGKVGTKVDWVAGRFRAGLSSISAWLPALGAIGAAASFGGLIEMTRKAAEGYEGLTLASKKLGASTGDLAVWRFGAKLAGVENEALEKGLVKLNKAMYDAATGKNKDVAALFRAMKIPLRDAHGQVKNVSNSLEDIAEAFKNTENPATRDAAAMVLFGKAGADLIPFLVKGRDGIRQLREEMKRYSGLTDENRHDLEELAVSYKNLDKAGSGLTTKLSAVFAPVMIKIVNGTTDWIVANRELIAQNLERKLDAIGKAFNTVWSGIRKVLDEPLVKSFTDTVDASTVLNGGLAILGVTMAGPVLAGINFVTAAVWRMNAAMFRNPFIAAAALIAGAAIEIVTHWDEVKEAFSNAWKEFGVAGVVFQAINVPVNALYRAFADLAKAIFGIDLDKWGKQFDTWINGMLDGFISRIEKVWSWIVKLKNSFTVMGGVDFSGTSSPPDTASPPAIAVPTASGLPSPPVPAAPSPDSPASIGQQATTQPVKVTISGEVKAPPGSQLTARVESGGKSSTADVGYSMMVP